MEPFTVGLIALIALVLVSAAAVLLYERYKPSPKNVGSGAGTSSVGIEQT